MDINSILKFLINNSIFSFSTVLVGFCLSYLLYDKVVTRGIDLKKSLFEHDNLAAWVEFTGAFVFPILYISAKALAGSVSDNLWMDLLVSLGYVVVYVLLFTLLRLTSGFIVRLFGCTDEHGCVSLNKEIYTQKNVAASLFSASLSTVFANLVLLFDPHPEFIVASLLKIGVILVISLAAFAGYLLILGRKTTLAREIFEDNNVAAGVEFVGFAFALQMILSSCMNLKEALNFNETILVACISVAIFGLLSGIFNVIFSKILKIDFWDEIYQEDNAGAAFGRVALYIGIASVVINFLG